jgi:hypothetical protein
MLIKFDKFKNLHWLIFERLIVINVPVRLCFLILNCNIRLVKTINCYKQNFSLHNDIPLANISNDNEILYSNFRFERHFPENEDDFYKLCKLDPNLYKIKDTYTKSTRLTQSIKYSKIFVDKIKYKKFIIFNLLLIMFNLEYRFNRTNNHILNNSRALIYAGYFMRSKSIISIGIKLWITYTKKLVINGWLNEGSAHYQLIFNNWFNDVMRVVDCITLTSKNDLLYLKNSHREVCDVSNGFINGKYILMGDVSPDRSIESICNQLKHTNPSNENVNNFYGKLQINSDKIEIIVVNEPNSTKYTPSHKHNDEYSFEIYKGDYKCLADPGLLSYKKEYAKYRGSEYHTSLGFNNYSYSNNLIVKKELINNQFKINCEYKNFTVIREIKIFNNTIYINDRVFGNKLSFCQFIITKRYYELNKFRINKIFTLSHISSIIISNFSGSYDYGCPDIFYKVKFNLHEPVNQLTTVIKL